MNKSNFVKNMRQEAIGFDSNKKRYIEKNSNPCPKCHIHGKEMTQKNFSVSFCQGVSDNLPQLI